MPVRTLITAEEFLDISTDVPVELVRGEIVGMGSPTVRHGFICVRIAVLLSTWTERVKAGFVVGNDAGVITERDPDTVRGPDCQFISAARLPKGIPADGYFPVPPDLAVEVVSRSDRWGEVMRKVNEYLLAGVFEVWVVDPIDESVEVFRSDRGPRRLARDDELTSDVLPGFACRVADFFTQR